MFFPAISPLVKEHRCRGEPYDAEGQAVI